MNKILLAMTLAVVSVTAQAFVDDDFSSGVFVLNEV